MKRYLVNEIFRSIQGEGAHAGTVMVFVRFAKCNLACSVDVEGFDCDTDFEHGSWYTLESLADAVQEQGCAGWVLLTGGEPALQIDRLLLERLHADGYLVAIETNGTWPLVGPLDWICVSPKLGHKVVVTPAHEYKFVIADDGELPDVTGLTAPIYSLSPAADGDTINPAALQRCIRMVMDNPRWTLSCQQHKWWGVR